MLRDRSAQGIWRLAGLCVLLCYPIMAIKWLPFGGGARYLSVLAAPVGLLMLLQTPRNEWRGLLLSAWRFSLPFLPFALGWTFAQIWHAYQPADMNPPTRVLWCALLFVGARQLGISYRHLAIVAGIAAVTYCVVAMTEVYGLGRDRAWGGTYENRFGQYAIWMAALCCLRQDRGALPITERFFVDRCCFGRSRYIAERIARGVGCFGGDDSLVCPERQRLAQRAHGRSSHDYGAACILSAL